MVFDKITLKSNKKGQLSMEFILIMSIILIMLLSMIIPMRDFSESNFNAMTKVAYAEKALYDVYNTAEKVCATDNGKLSIMIYIPKDVNFEINDSGLISYDINFDFEVASCNNTNVCGKSLQTCGNVLQNNIFNSEGRYEIIIQK